MTATDRSHVLIAGGGIAGVATAIALADRGIAVSIFEQRPTPTTDGAGIQLGPNAVRCLRALGAADAITPAVAVPDEICVRRFIDGQQLSALPLGPWIAKRHGAPYWTAHRADLYAGLRETLSAHPNVKEHVGVTVVSWSQTDDTITVTTTQSNAETTAAEPVMHTGSALLLADGIWSRHRAPKALVAAGKVACRAIVDATTVPSDIDKNSTGIWLGRDHHVVHYPIRGGDQTALVVIFDEARAEPVWDRGDIDNEVADKIASATPSLRTLLERAPGWSGWSLYEDDLQTPWRDGRVLRIGDAAHPILPFFAQGGAMALEDAVMLAACCGATDDVATAFADFERQRRPRIARVADASRNNGRTYHLSGVAARARDAALQWVPGARLMARYDWLYGWTPPQA